MGAAQTERHARVLRVDADPRVFAIVSKEFTSDGKGNVAGIRTAKVEWVKDEAGRFQMREIPGSEEVYAADLVLLAMGFLGPEATLVENSETRAQEHLRKAGISDPLSGWH